MGLCLLGLLAVPETVPPALAAQLPVHTLTVSDGLNGDQVTCLLQDHRGVLWVGGTTGISRYDGRRFISYSTADGLPHPVVLDLAEDPSGHLWVATAGGLARLRDLPTTDGSLFDVVSSTTSRPLNMVRSLVIDDDGTVWAAVSDNLYLGSAGSVAPCFDEGPRDIGPEVSALARSVDGSLWIGTSDGLVRRLPSGRSVRYRLRRGSRNQRITTLDVDTAGRVWFSCQSIFVVYPEEPAKAEGFEITARATAAAGPHGIRLPGAPGEVLELGHIAGLPATAIHDITTTTEGPVWIGTHQGLAVLEQGSLRILTSAHGLAGNEIQAVLRDSADGLWVGTHANGLMRIPRRGFVNFTRADGLATGWVAAVVSDRDHQPVVVGFPPSSYLHRVSDERLVAIPIPRPPGGGGAGWGLNQVTFQDSRGSWWVPTDRGVLRFPPVSTLDDLAAVQPDLLDRSDGLVGEEVFRLWEDSSGDVWMGVFRPSRLVVWHRATGEMQPLGAAQGVPEDAATAFAEDHAGNIWVGFYEGGMVRRRRGGFEHFGAEHGAPAGFVHAFHVGRHGRLWIGTSHDGLVVVDDPTADEPQFRRVTSREGFVGDRVLTVTEDRQGRIYAGTTRGVERFDPVSGRLEHFDTRAGLVNNVVFSSFCDADGDLWFATAEGVSRLTPDSDELRSPPEVLITGVTVSGEPRPISQMGLREVGPLQLAVGDRVVEVDLSWVDLDPRRMVQVQYALEGADGPWSRGSEEPHLRLAGLAPGRYRVLFRTVLPDSRSGPPARLLFTIPRPLWQRWWFLAGLAGLLVAASVVGYRVRMGRLLELQEVRERIAGDLHDEVGLGLTRISMLSEVAKSRGGPPSLQEDLEAIGEEARELIDATSVMAWALDPRRDEVKSVATRLRRLMADVFEPIGVSWTLDAPDDGSLPLAGERRRHLLLILKEAINNIARHAQAHRVEVRLAVRSGMLDALVRDDGQGFDSGAVARGDSTVLGSGLINMQRRAKALGGELSIRSQPGQGTTVMLRAPVAGAHHHALWAKLRGV